MKCIHFTYIPILCILYLDSKYIYYFFRATQKEKQECEKMDAVKGSKPAAAAMTPSIPVTPTVSMPVASSQSTPQSLPISLFETPHSARPIPSFETPCSTRHMSHVTTPGSPASTAGSVDSNFNACTVSNSSGLTPEVNHMTFSMRRGRSRPHKTPCPPTYDDFPADGREDDKKKRKNRKKWRYKKLTSTDAGNFREREKECVSHYVSYKRQDLVDAAGGHSSVYKHIKEEELTQKSKVKEKSRKR